MRSLIRLVSPVALAVVLAVGACSSTTASIEQSWHSPSLQPGVLTKVAVLSPSGNGAVARSAEDQLAADLRARGIYAVSGYSVLPPWARGNRDAVVSELRRGGFDGVVTMRVVSATQQLDYYPTFDMYWGATWGAVYPQTVVRIEMNAYSIPSNRLVWSALSKSIDPESVNELIDDVAEVGAKNLARYTSVARK